eukprot:m.478968 g.478968  ORF g.478968 m.478968 type:complete len:485 (+) comp21288_c0_seq1:150-1604(+)
MRAAVFVLLAATAVVVSSSRITRVVVLMEENRSFDHFFGYNKHIPQASRINGTETNPLNTSDPSSPKVPVTPNSPYVGPCDPCHGTPCTTEKLYGKNGDFSKPATMSGFVEYESKHKDYCGVMEMFTPDRIPIISTLAEEYAVFDRFFAAHPGPTWPNRLFMLTGTSAGCTETGTYYHNEELHFYPQKTIFDSLLESDKTWKHYFADVPWELGMLRSLQKHPERIQNMEQFHDDVRNGNLPHFSWINPRAGVNMTTLQGSNDQHPDHDVALGEALMKEIYESLRAGPQWNETLFIITMDEHGGFWDSVPPPTGVPAPDDEKSYPDQFDFTRLGVRIPTVLVSPWLKKGTIISNPTAEQKPAPNSEFDLTSIIATIKNMFGLKSFLTKRDAWAATFHNVFEELDAPRSDCPETLPPAPKSLSADAAAWEAARPLNDLQENFLVQLANLTGVPAPGFNTQGAISDWLLERTHTYLQAAKAQKAAKL